MRIETNTSKFPAGSGRSCDWVFPSLDARRDNNTGVLNIQNRNTEDTATQVWATGTGTNGFAIHNGVPCVSLVTTTVGGYSLTSNTSGNVRIFQTKGHGVPVGYNDGACVRHVIVMAMDANFNASTADYGYEVIFPVDDTFPGIIANAIGGCGWVRRPSGSMALIIQGGGFHEFDITTPGFDPTQFHAYEFRFLSATKTAEAGFKALVDGVLFQSFAWGAGTILPLYQNIYRQGVQGIYNHQGIIGSTIWVQGWQASYAPTEAALL